MTTHIAQPPAGEAPTLRQRVLRAGGWSVAGFALSQVIRFGTNLVMTRLLAPEMFGVMTIAQMVMIGLMLFSDLGLRLNIIQSRRGSDPVFLNTAWVTQILVGCLLALGAILVASSLALANHLGLLPPESTYAAPTLPYVLAALGFERLMAGFESTKARGVEPPPGVGPPHPDSDHCAGRRGRLDACACRRKSLYLGAGHRHPRRRCDGDVAQSPLAPRHTEPRAVGPQGFPGDPRLRQVDSRFVGDWLPRERGRQGSPRVDGLRELSLACTRLRGFC